MTSTGFLKEIAVFAILTAEDINDTIQIIVDYRVGLCPFNVQKCNVTDMLLPHGGGKFYWICETGALNDRSAEQNVAGITPGICTVPY